MQLAIESMADNTELKDNQPEESLPLNEEEKQAMEKLRNGLPAELLVCVDDGMLTRFVRGYWQEKDREEKTLSTLISALEWRKTVNADSICEKPLGREREWMSYWPYDFIGFDKRGHPVYYERTAFFDPSKFLKAFTVEEITQYHVQMQETMSWIKEKQTRESGYLTYKGVIIMDLQDLGRKHLSSSFTGTIKSIVNSDQYYYPETLYKFFIVNAPLLFKMLWSVVRPWLHPITQKRITICGGTKDYLPKLKELMDENEIPAYLGGKNEAFDAKGIDQMLDMIVEKHEKLRLERNEYYEKKESTSS